MDWHKTIFKAFMENTNWTGSRDRDLGDTDQTKGLPPPPLELDYDETQRVIDLPAPGDIDVDAIDLRTAIENRISVRSYAEQPITLDELSWLLWSTQGVKRVTDRPSTLRPVPSGGARHPFETYLVVNRVKGLPPGLYRFLAIKHKLIELSLDPGLAGRIVEVCWAQPFLANNAVTFLWAFVPYRATWRYGNRGFRSGLIEIGHVCQNLYLAAAAIHCGACAVGAFGDKALHQILHIDLKEQVILYLATVGKMKEGR